MSNLPSNPASASPAQQAAPPQHTPLAPPSNEADMDLAGAVDQLLADIDAAGASLVQDLAAEAPPPSDAPTVDASVAKANPDAEPADAAIQPEPASLAAGPALGNAAPDEHTAPEAKIAAPPSEPASAPPPSNEDLLAELDALVQQANTSTSAPAAPAPAADSVQPPSTVPVEHPATQASAPSAGSIDAIDEEVSRLADQLLEQPSPGLGTPPPPPATTHAPPSPAPRTAAPLEPSPNTAREDEPPREPRPSIATRIGSRVGPMLVSILTPLSAPLRNKPAMVRQSAGWIACSTVFFSAVLWGVVLTRRPASLVHEGGTFDFRDGEPPQLPVVAHEETPGKAEHGQTASEKGEASGEHAKAPPKGDAHGASKSSKAPAKKPPRQNRVAAKSKKAPPPAEHE